MAIISVVWCRWNAVGIRILSLSSIWFRCLNHLSCCLYLKMKYSLLLQRFQPRVASYQFRAILALILREWHLNTKNSLIWHNFTDLFQQYYFSISTYYGLTWLYKNMQGNFYGVFHEYVSWWKKLMVSKHLSQPRYCGMHVLHIKHIHNQPHRRTLLWIFSISWKILSIFIILTFSFTQFTNPKVGWTPGLCTYKLKKWLVTRHFLWKVGC